MTGVEQVFAVFISGDLLTKAVDKVKSDGLYNTGKDLQDHQARMTVLVKRKNLLKELS